MINRSWGKLQPVGSWTDSTLCLFLRFLEYHTDNHESYFNSLIVELSSTGTQPGHNPYQPRHEPGSSRPRAATGPNLLVKVSINILLMKYWRNRSQFINALFIW